MAKILIAGEDYMNLDSVSATIGAEGHEVRLAVTGLDAYEQTLAEQPDLVMLEITMPIFNGFETCTMIREDPEIPKTLPIIFLAADDIDARQMEQVGATDQIPKLHMSVDLRANI